MGWLRQFVESTRGESGAHERRRFTLGGRTCSAPDDHADPGSAPDYGPGPACSAPDDNAGPGSVPDDDAGRAGSAPDHGSGCHTGSDEPQRAPARRRRWGRGQLRRSQRRRRQPMSPMRTFTSTPGPIDPASVARRGPRPGGQRRSAWKLLATRMPATASPTMRVAIATAKLAGAALIVATGLIHLHLWAAGYRNIPTIGALFLAQAVLAGVFAIALVAIRSLGSALLSAAFLAATAGGLVVSATTGLFGFRDGLDAPWAGTSLVVEGIGFVVLTLVSVALAWSARPLYESAPVATVALSRPTSPQLLNPHLARLLVDTRHRQHLTEAGVTRRLRELRGRRRNLGATRTGIQLAGAESHRSEGDEFHRSTSSYRVELMDREPGQEVPTWERSQCNHRTD